MTPLAKQELRRYCRDAARAKRARDRWTAADWGDFIVAVGCVVGLIFLGGFGFAEYRHETRAKSCAKEIDGRRLTAYHLTADGPTECRYEAPPTRKGRL